nr:MAG TPA: hypothetical protein [Caudoviricetes sp.]
MATYGLIYTYDGNGSYSIRDTQDKRMPKSVEANVPERVEAAHFGVLEDAVRAGLSNEKDIEVLGVRCAHTTIDHRHALFAVFDLSVPGVE